MKRDWIVLACIALLVFGCAKGKDGEDGDAYGYLVGFSGDVTGVDFSEIGITDTTIFTNTRYKLTPGPATMYWELNNTSVYGVDVEIEIEEGEKGKDATLPLGEGTEGAEGDDHLYYAEIDSTILYFTDEYVGHGDAPETLAVMSANSASPGVQVSIPNRSLR